MKKLTLFIFGTTLSLSVLTYNCSPMIVLYAQSLPITLHALWNPSIVDQSHPAPIQYSITMDSSAAVILPASSCVNNSCSQAVTINNYGDHILTVCAQVQTISTDPTTLTNSCAAPLAWKLSPPSNNPTGTTIKN